MICIFKYIIVIIIANEHVLHAYVLLCLPPTRRKIEDQYVGTKLHSPTSYINSFVSAHNLEAFIQCFIYINDHL